MKKLVIWALKYRCKKLIGAPLFRVYFGNMGCLFRKSKWHNDLYICYETKSGKYSELAVGFRMNSRNRVKTAYVVDTKEQKVYEC